MNTTSDLLPHIRLQFNIKHPNLDECYLAGYESALAEKEELTNPFLLGTAESHSWLEGWWAGIYGEAPLYPYEVFMDEENDTDDSENKLAANDTLWTQLKTYVVERAIEISAMIAVLMVAGYQLVDLIA